MTRARPRRSGGSGERSSRRRCAPVARFLTGKGSGCRARPAWRAGAGRQAARSCRGARPSARPRSMRARRRPASSRDRTQSRVGDRGSDFAMVFALRDGDVVAFQKFTDAAAVNAAFDGAEQPADARSDALGPTEVPGRDAAVGAALLHASASLVAPYQLIVADDDGLLADQTGD